MAKGVINTICLHLYKLSLSLHSIIFLVHHIFWHVHWKHTFSWLCYHVQVVKYKNPYETWLNDEDFRRMTHYTPHEVHWLPVNCCVNYHSTWKKVIILLHNGMKPKSCGWRWAMSNTTFKALLLQPITFHQLHLCHCFQRRWI